MSKSSNAKESAKVIAQREADKEKRRKERLSLMQKGMEDLEVWLCDIIRDGTATTESQPYAFWQDCSARMVDTQLSAIGPKIRSLQLLHHAESDWPNQMLEELGALYLLARGFHRLETLPHKLQDQLLRIAGIRDQKKDLLLNPGLVDHWGVLGQFEGINIDNGRFRRTWFRGAKSRAHALILEYDYQNRGYETEWEVGHIYTGAMIYYPASYPQRTLFKDPKLEEDKRIRQMKGYENANSFLDDYANALASNPWLPDFPCCLEMVTPVFHKGTLSLIDQLQHQVPVHVKEAAAWQLQALSGGHPITVFGEWTGAVFLPLSVMANNRFVSLAKQVD